MSNFNVNSQYLPRKVQMPNMQSAQTGGTTSSAAGGTYTYFASASPLPTSSSDLVYPDHIYSDFEAFLSFSEEDKEKDLVISRQISELSGKIYKTMSEIETLEQKLLQMKQQLKNSDPSKYAEKQNEINALEQQLAEKYALIKSLSAELTAKYMERAEFEKQAKARASANNGVSEN